LVSTAITTTTPITAAAAAAATCTTSIYFVKIRRPCSGCHVAEV